MGAVWDIGSSLESDRPVCGSSLTQDDEDEEEGGHAGGDVEHDADVVGQHVHVVHIGHQDGGHQEPDGDTELRRARHHFNNMARFRDSYDSTTFTQR